MYAVIVGCGLVGSRVATMLSRDGHTVSIIDLDPSSFHHLAPEFDGLTIVGVGFDEEVLIKAGIQEADVFAALTDNDNVNILSSAVAKNIFNVQRAITRVYDPSREKTFRALGLEIVTPTMIGAEQVYSRFIMGENLAHLYLGENEIEFFEHAYEPLGKQESIAELEKDGQVRVIALIRKGKSYLPTSDEILLKGDRIVSAVALSSMHKSIKTFAKKNNGGS
ncbi:MAG TPA: TrkA family potassium uptake protein [Caldisericia bacterium]|nr:TrkA family potassium uptake protein [Caldisericia bacterium]